LAAGNNTKHSIIIPTFNRPDLLRRILSYYDSCGERYKVIVADSSSEENKALNSRVVTSVSNLNIQYLDNYPVTLNPGHKFADLMNYVQEEYCVFCADDDFVTPHGINKSVDFLEKNRDFVVAHGRYVFFHLETNSQGEQRFIWESAYTAESIRSPQAEDRLTEHLSRYFLPTIYAVHRTDVLKKAYRELINCHVSPILFGELLPSMFTMIYGKMECLDVFYMARTRHEAKHWPMDLREAINAGKYDEEYAKFRDCLATHMNRQSQMDIEKSKKVIDTAMAAYINRHYPLKSKAGRVLDSLNLPGWADKGISRSYEILAGRKKIRKQAIELSPGSKNYEDLEKIRLHVLSSLKMSDK
jgi:glycosyltransferase domain-containing protein